MSNAALRHTSESARRSSSGRCLPHPWHAFKWIAFAAPQPFPTCLSISRSGSVCDMQHGARQPVSTRARRSCGSPGRKFQNEHLKAYTTLGHVICTQDVAYSEVRDAEINGIPPSGHRLPPSPPRLHHSTRCPAILSERNITCICDECHSGRLLQLPGPGETCPPRTVPLSWDRFPATPPIHAHEATLPSRTHPTSQAWRLLPWFKTRWSPCSHPMPGPQRSVHPSYMDQRTCDW